MTSQFITAIGAFVGTFLGIWIAESAGAGGTGEKDAAGVFAARTAGFLGTSVRPADLVIPGTAGGTSLPRAFLLAIVDGIMGTQDSFTSHRFRSFLNFWPKVVLASRLSKRLVMV